MKNNLLIFLITGFCLFLFYLYGRGIWHPMLVKIVGKRTVADVIQIYGDETERELRPVFAKVGIDYPPKALALIAFKDTRVLEVWASNEGVKYSLAMTYPIQAASGQLGPKLKEGDRQVPEGIYQITGFNPNSSYHLSMKLNYPNAFDLKHARSEGRDQPGTNIFIHGRSVSIGCLAMGDGVIEKLFSLVYTTGKSNTIVLISPTDPSKGELLVPKGAPAWTSYLYDEIDVRYQEITQNKLND